ncbi:TAXI family TRAP transporter solute-binding subunit [Propionivibrio soli]|uniref:TAXI family TRAP transporter solute-binding subunit n=1 Tax=Propionivibrio soli TaxID=2976531 RepID=UPI0021E718BB|nr:TAXI family TRAP transporter solute-binding subunit [Propionivibrio soli]
MNALRAKFISIRDLLATAWPIVLITAIGFVIAYQFVQPAPPRRITITTGGETGAYYAYAKRYAELLAVNGITLEIKTSAGSAQNLERLKNGEADVALVQGGIQDVASEDTANLVSLGSVSYEPVWVFYRNDRRLDRLHQLDGRRIAVGEEGSGIRGLALQLLEANEIAGNAPNLSPVTGLNAAEELQQSRIDATFVVAAPEAPVVQVLLRSPGVRVMSFSQADAYTRRFPFLSRIVLPRGVVDLVRDTPPRDTVLLATTANVVVRDDLHPALASLFLQAMSEVHGKSGFFHAAGEFPAYRDRTFELSADAARYYKSGPSFLQRYLPFWLAVLVERLFVLVVPVVVLLLPLLRLAPSVYSWRVRSKIFRCYGDLKFMENEIRQHYDAARHSEYLARLDRIEEDAYSRNIPLAFSDLLYTLREHINLVRQKLQHLQSGQITETTS